LYILKLPYLKLFGDGPELILLFAAASCQRVGSLTVREGALAYARADTTNYEQPATNRFCDGQDAPVAPKFLKIGQIERTALIFGMPVFSIV
jgi:hypothetical protein